MWRENRNAPDSPDLSLTIPDYRMKTRLKDYELIIKDYVIIMFLNVCGKVENSVYYLMLLC